MIKISIMKLVDKDQILFFKSEDIIRISGTKQHSTVHFRDGRRTDLHASLEQITSQLKESSFIRIHEQHIINANHISRISDASPDIIELDNHERIPITESTKNQIINALSDNS